MKMVAASSSEMCATWPTAAQYRNLKSELSCIISGFHRSVNEVLALLGWPLKVGPIVCLKTLVTIYKSLCNIPEELSGLSLIMDQYECLEWEECSFHLKCGLIQFITKQLCKFILWLGD